MKFLRLTAMAVMALSIMLVACGDDEAPTEPGDNPTPSTLSATAGTSNNVNASWTMCPDNDFDEYNLYRSTSPDISSDPPSSPVRTSSNASDTTFTDTGLDWGETYYYALQTKNTGSNTVWSNEVQVVMPDSGGGCLYLTCYDIQGQQAESPYVGETVEVTGIITADPDDFTATSYTYSVLSDPGAGPWSGLLLYGSELAGIQRGDSVIITGYVTEYYGMTELSTDSYTVISSGHSLPTPETMDTGDLATSQNPEQWESVFVTVSDANVTQIGLPYYTWALNDGSGECYAGTMGDFSYNPAVGDTINSMTGLLWYSRDNFKIEPRDDSDIDVSGGGGGGDVYSCYEIQGQQSSSPFEGQTVSVTGIVTAGADDFTATSYTYSALADQDGGAWSGLLLFGNDLAGLERGDSVTVNGSVSEYYEMTEVTAASYEVHSTGHNLPAPELMSTSDLATSQDPEQWESVFVKVSDANVTQIGLPHYTWALNDGSGECYAGTMGDFSYNPAVGNTINSMTGLLWYSYDNFKIEPRDDSDIVLP